MNYYSSERSHSRDTVFHIYTQLVQQTDCGDSINIRHNQITINVVRDVTDVGIAAYSILT